MMYENTHYSGVISLCNELLSSDEIENNIPSKIEANQLLSKVYYHMGNYAKALTYALNAAELLEGSFSVIAALENVNCFAKVLIRSNSYDEAIKLIKKGLKLANKNDKSQQVSYMFYLIGRSYMGLNEYDQAEGYLKNALEIAEKNKYMTILSEIKINTAQLYIRKGVYGKAKNLVDEALLIALKENQIISLIQCYLLNAHISFEKKKYQNSIEFLQKAEELSEENGLYQELVQAYEWLCKIYPYLNDYEKAYRASLKYIQLQKDLYNKDRERELYKVRAQYDYYSQQQEMRSLKADYAKVTQQRQELQYIMDVLGKQNEELLSIAINDYLTGTYNRKYFMLKFEEEFSIADEHGKALSCLVFDIDKFKLINDSYGHLAGDEVIKHVVSICNLMTDKKDIIGRFGGDEFVIILMEKGLDQAVNIGQTILEYLWKSPITIENQEIYTTISLGVTDNIIGNPNNAEDMIRIADKALYQAKNNGRNQLCVAWEQQKDYDY